TFILTVLFCAVCWVECVLGAAACCCWVLLPATALLPWTGGAACCHCLPLHLSLAGASLVSSLPGACCCHEPAGACCCWYGCNKRDTQQQYELRDAFPHLVFVFLAAEYATPQNSLNQAPYVTQGLAYREYTWKHGASDGKLKPIVCYEV
ncbi:hypothetical protein IFM89_020390, partial [Coptis chinensis]